MDGLQPCPFREGLLVLSLQPPDVAVEHVHLALVFGAEGGEEVLVELAVQPFNGGLRGLQNRPELGQTPLLLGLHPVDQVLFFLHQPDVEAPEKLLAALAVLGAAWQSWSHFNPKFTSFGEQQSYSRSHEYALGSSY